MSIGYFTGKTEELRELVKCWRAEQNGDDFGLDLQVDNALVELEVWRQGEDTAIITQVVDGKIIGFLCIFCTDSLLLNRRIAIEKYWFVMPDYRMGGVKLLHEARKWAKQNNCTHLAMVASNLASDKYEGVSRMFEKMGMKLFETSYITEV